MEQKSIDITIIIPCYNVEKYLDRCMISVINQTLQNIEIIVIDDKSTDKTPSIIYKYHKLDKRIQVIAFEKNKGVANARNAGIKKAKGKYIGFLDSDDYVDLDFYEKLYIKAIETKSDITKGMATSVKNISTNILKKQIVFL
jgi:glycosyltransferase involved in cell wall biosynthesis